MTTYMVIEAEISDAKQFKDYALAAADLVAEFGDEYIVRATPPMSLEAVWPDAVKLVISKWASQRQALAFWNSSEYAKIKKLRLGTAKVRVTLFEGVDEK
ncbi:MAG: DUF1330 domain-containing protein [Robiginitomaculum sp.]|nr:DUF1330 domain-containing protein [Robiginitomaculum sp.]